MEMQSELPAHFNEPQYLHIKNSILEPIVLTITEACHQDRACAQQLINIAKEKQIDGDVFVQIYGRDNHVLLDALNGLTCLYNRENNFQRIYGANNTSLPLRRQMLDHMIANLLNQQYSPPASIEAMRELRELVLAWSIAKRNFGQECRVYDDFIIAAKRRHQIPNVHMDRNGTDGYYENPDISHLDLSGMDLSNLDYLKGMQLKNGNYSYCNFSNNFFSTANFSGSNLSYANFTNCNMASEEVSFANADCTGAIFIDVVMERGNTWVEINRPEDIKAEIIARGGLNVDRAIFSTLPAPELEEPDLASQLATATLLIRTLESRLEQRAAHNPNSFFMQPSPARSSNNSNHTESKCVIL